MTKRSSSRDDAPPDLLNLGPVSRRWLREVGVRSQADLTRIGVVEAYRRVKAKWPGASLNLLYALEGAVRGVHWTMVPPKVREDLKRQAAAPVDAAPPGPGRRSATSDKIRS